MSQPMRITADGEDRSRYMQSSFYGLADELCGGLGGDEALLAYLRAEDSDFVRINGGRIRQAGEVRRRVLSLRLVDGRRHATVELAMTGVRSVDELRAKAALTELRERLPHLPDDPHLLYHTDPSGGEHHGDALIPDAHEAVDAILAESAGLDLVGIYAGGGIYEGFASSLGQRNWYSSFSFNLDFACYHRDDKAIKSGYAGFAWERSKLAARIADARRQLALVARPARTVEPGRYRVYLAPAAVRELLALLSWGSFGLKAQRTRQSPLQRLVDGKRELSAAFTLRENTRGGIAASFDASGFPKAPTVPLVTTGRHVGSLVSPRSAAEFGVPTNGADDEEMPHSLDLDAGDIEPDRLLAELGTGVWVNNLWYTNYSDRSAGRITGMTRFATFWVEGGEIVAPLNVMRFDETIYRMFGSELIGLSAERELMLDPETYFHRSTGSAVAPGALVEGFTFTL